MLTAEEKSDLVVGVGMPIAGLPLPPEMQGPADGPMGPRVPGAGGMTRAVPRLGIPSIVLADGPAGAYGREGVGEPLRLRSDANGSHAVRRLRRNPQRGRGYRRAARAHRC